MIIADENIDFNLIVILREAGFEILSIAERHPGKDDKDILELVKSLNGILIQKIKTLVNGFLRIKFQMLT